MASASLVSKWRRGTAELKPVEIDGDITIDHVDQMLLAAYEFGLANIFIKPGRHVVAGPGNQYVLLSDRRMSPSDVERFANILWSGGNPVQEMNQGKPLDFRYDLPTKDQGYVSFRGSMKKVDGIGVSNYSISIRPLASSPPPWEELEIEEPITQNLLPDSGLVTFVGKTDSGKTTMQSSALDFIGRTAVTTQKIEEYGAPIEYLQNDLDWSRCFYVGTNMGVDLRPDPDFRGGLMSFACMNAMRNAPTLVVISEARDDATFRGITEVSLTGHTGMTTMHTSGPAETIGRMCLAAPPEQRDGFASEILGAMHMVVHQRLIRAKAGGRIGVREFLIFDNSVKTKLALLPYKEWGETIKTIMMDADRRFSQRFDQALNTLIERDLITQAEYDERLNGLQKLGVAA